MKCQNVEFDLLKFDFLENEKSFWSEVKNILPGLTSALV